jgi:HlyD family secretion protein
MDKKLRNRTLLFLIVAGVLAFILIRVSGRQPVAKISALQPVRENIISSITSNGKVEPVSPYVIRAQSDTFVERLHVNEGQNVKKGQLLLELNVKEAAAQLAQAKSRLLRAEDELQAAKAGGHADESARVSGDLAKALADRDRLQQNHESLERTCQQRFGTNQDAIGSEPVNGGKERIREAGRTGEFSRRALRGASKKRCGRARRQGGTGPDLCEV